MVRKTAFFALLVSPAIAAANPYTGINYPNANLTMREQVNPPPFFLREPANPVQRAARAFGACVEHAMPGLDPALSAEAGAARLTQTCATSLRALQTASERVIDESHLRPERKDRARTELRARLDLAEPRLVERLRRYRATAASLVR